MRWPMTSMNFLAANGAALSDMGLPVRAEGGLRPMIVRTSLRRARPVADATGPLRALPLVADCSPRNGALATPSGAQFCSYVFDRPTYSSPASNATVAAWATTKPYPSRLGDAQSLTTRRALPATQAALPAMITHTPR